MGLLDLLAQYKNATAGQAVAAAPDHFHEVAQSAPPEVVAQGISAALRSDQTPAFGQMVSQLFQQGNPQQQTGMLNQLLAGLAPSALSALAGAGLGNLVPGAAGASQLTPDQVARLSPQQVQQIAEHAEKHNPTIIDQMSNFYAQHPGLVKTLGSAALTIALAKISNNMRA